MAFPFFMTSIPSGSNMPTPLFRRALPEDADFLARATLAASRSHLPTGYFDLLFPVEEPRLLALLARVQLASEATGGRGWGHWTDYQVLEGQDAAGRPLRLGALCACPASALPAFPFPAEALREAGLGLGWTPEALAAAQARIDVYLDRLEDIVLSEDEETLFVQFVHVPREHRRQGHARRMMTLLQQQAEAEGRRRLELFTDLGNDPAERLYVSLGFVLVEEYRYHNFPAEELALIGPGMRRWQLMLG